MTFAKGAYESNKLETNLEKEASRRKERKSTQNRVGLADFLNLDFQIFQHPCFNP